MDEDSTIGTYQKVRLATFINDDTIRVNEFGTLEAYIGEDGALVVTLDPKSKAKARSFAFGRK
jgi:hypothetical protein